MLKNTPAHVCSMHWKLREFVLNPTYENFLSCASVQSRTVPFCPQECSQAEQYIQSGNYNKPFQDHCHACCHEMITTGQFCNSIKDQDDETSSRSLGRTRKYLAALGLLQGIHLWDKLPDHIHQLTEAMLKQSSSWSKIVDKWSKDTLLAYLCDYLEQMTIHTYFHMLTIGCYIVFQWLI